MTTAGLMKKVIPTRVRGAMRRLVNRLVDFGENRILSSLYTPESNDRERRQYYFSSQSLKAEPHPSGLPVPPAQMRMGYSVNSEQAFLERGEKTASMVRSVMEKYSIRITKDDAVMEYGCATGRVLRYFAREAETAEFWGVDQDELSILWDKVNLSPPFNFVVTTSYPHLPFEDQKFSFIYGISVFTHIRHLADTWLMEINRVLKSGSYALMTVMDENSIEVFKKQGREVWMFPEGIDVNRAQQFDFAVAKGDDWGGTFSVYHGDWIRREWGRYFEVVEIIPHAEDGYQSAVVLRKR